MGLAHFNSSEGKLRRRLVFLFKLLFTIIFCTIIVWKADWYNIWQAFRNSNPYLLLVVFVCSILCVTISTYKWQKLLFIHGIRLSFNKLHRYYFIAMFFNNFLPTNIGGDSYRIYKTWSIAPSRTGAFIAVITERITGIWVLLLMGFIGCVIILSSAEMLSFPLEMVAGIFVLLLIVPIGFIIVSKTAARKLLVKINVPDKIQKAFEHIEEYGRHPLITMQVMLISLFFHLFTLGWMMILLHAVGTNFSITALAITIAISNIIAVLPLSINGIGLLDGSFIYVAGRFGLTYEYALMFMLLFRAMNILISFAGSLIYLRDKTSITVEDLHNLKLS